MPHLLIALISTRSLPATGHAHAACSSLLASSGTLWLTPECLSQEHRCFWQPFSSVWCVDLWQCVFQAGYAFMPCSPQFSVVGRMHGFRADGGGVDGGRGTTTGRGGAVDIDIDNSSSNQIGAQRTKDTRTRSSRGTHVAGAPCISAFPRRRYACCG